MKKLLAFVLCLVTLLACALPVGAESYVYVRHTEKYWAEPYYHRNPACAFSAELDMCESVKLIKCSAATAQKNNCRPCPICAYSFKPMFTGSFPKWKYKTPAYYLGGERHWLSASKLNKFGNAARMIEQWREKRSPSDYYAGVYRNDSGTYTLLMTHPLSSRANGWKRALKSDFWVIEAKYSEKQLNKLYAYAQKLMGKYKINSIGMDVTANRVAVGTSDNSTANMKKIYAALKAKGFPQDAVWIYKSQPGSTEF
ncbi:MAG: hypothetical protein K5663_04020 [Clostridiales bacterium]|nr:hypothetical protein [Clostridiales bacterium]